MKKDIDLIRETVGLYFEVVTNKEHDKILESWHQEAKMNYIGQEGLVSVPRTFWQDYCSRPDNPDEKVSCSITSIDITGRAAVVRTEITKERTESTIRYTDYLTLLKESDEKWVIISKAFHTDIHPKE